MFCDDYHDEERLGLISGRVLMVLLFSVIVLALIYAIIWLSNANLAT